MARGKKNTPEQIVSLLCCYQFSEFLAKSSSSYRSGRKGREEVDEGNPESVPYKRVRIARLAISYANAYLTLYVDSPDAQADLLRRLILDAFRPRDTFRLFQRWFYGVHWGQ